MSLNCLNNFSSKFWIPSGRKSILVIKFNGCACWLACTQTFPNWRRLHMTPIHSQYFSTPIFSTDSNIQYLKSSIFFYGLPWQVLRNLMCGKLSSSVDSSDKQQLMNPWDIKCLAFFLGMSVVREENFWRDSNFRSSNISGEHSAIGWNGRRGPENYSKVNGTH